jgi:hypothetical protein
MNKKNASPDQIPPSPQPAANPRPEKIILATVITLFLTLVFTAPTLESWVEVSKPNLFIRVMTPVVRGGASLSEFLGVHQGLSDFRQGFHSWRRNEPPIPPEILAVNLPNHGPLLEGEEWPLPWPLGAKGERGPFHPGNPLEILIVGDSMAGLEAAVAFREWDRRQADLRITLSYKISSSFSNTSLLDWPKKIDELTRSRYYDAIFVWIGTNDAQSIFTLGKEYLFDTPGWYTEYNRRVRAFLDIATAHCTRLYWIALPPMRPEGYRERMRTLKAHQRSLVLDYENASFLDLDPILGDAEGQYVKTKVVEGQQRVIRANDGIHLTLSGNILLSDGMDAAVREDFSFLEE